MKRLIFSEVVACEYSLFSSKYVLSLTAGEKRCTLAMNNDGRRLHLQAMAILAPDFDWEITS